MSGGIEQNPRLPGGLRPTLSTAGLAGQWVAEATDPFGAPLVYAVGDVHGMDDLLAGMLACIEVDASQRRPPATVVFLGDVVNRGPQTRQVLDRLTAGPTCQGQRWIVLRGNHEQAMLEAVTTHDEAKFRRWLKMGGMQSLASYGGTRKHATPDRARALIDPAHVDFLSGLSLTHVVGDYLFVHAGVEPGVPLHKHRPHKLMTMRGGFLKKVHRLPYVVVHGHTPALGGPMIGPGRIGVDTGACISGILTAVAIEPNSDVRRFLRVTTTPSRADAVVPARS
jgi:serine/threonine protein phosphatase 1